jgi:hypothetical protein
VNSSGIVQAIALLVAENSKHTTDIYELRKQLSSLRAVLMFGGIAFLVSHAAIWLWMLTR